MSEPEATVLRCYRCGASLATLTLPLSRLDLCPDCGVELHVCRMCLHYAPSKPDACDEDDAPEVKNKTSPNFCDYFAPSTAAYDRAARRADTRARGELAALFGDAADDAERSDAKASEAGTDATSSALDAAQDLFKK